MRRSTDYGRAFAALVLLLPLVSMFLVPFSDTTEPRYAEIARLMAQTGDWITPWFSPGVPFWGKPPLAFWAEAASMRVLGMTEIAARLPSWLCLLAVLGMLYSGMRRLRGEGAALLTVIIYATSALVYISAGAVLTDPFLALGTTWSMMSFALAVSAKADGKTAVTPVSISGVGPDRASPVASLSWFWRYGFFAGMAIGLLAKGPLALVLILAPVAAWMALHRRDAATAAPRLPWRSGLLLVLLLSLPWYILAELKTPGFLDYFIVGEHIRRFLDPGWAGDLYGTAHREHFGMIWWFWLQASFPWGALVLALLAWAPASRRIRASVRDAAGDPLAGYWLSWALFTPVFFTVSANILWTYLLPALGGFSILAASLLLALAPRRPRLSARALALAALVPVGILGWSVNAAVRPDALKTERGLVNYVAHQAEPGVPLLYLGYAPFSASFYSAGQAGAVDMAGLGTRAHGTRPFYLAVPREELKPVAGVLGHALAPVYENKRYILIRIDNGDAPSPLAYAQSRSGRAYTGNTKTQ